MRRQSWLITALTFGVLYAVVGIVLALPTLHVRVWRLAAWALSAVLYLTHIGYEKLKLRYAPRSIALHVATAVGLGALLLAISAIVHSLYAPPDYSRWKFALAIVVWPLITGVPAFLFAFVIAMALKQSLDNANHPAQRKTL